MPLLRENANMLGSTNLRIPEERRFDLHMISAAGRLDFFAG